MLAVLDVPERIQLEHGLVEATTEELLDEEAAWVVQHAFEFPWLTHWYALGAVTLPLQ